MATRAGRKIRRLQAGLTAADAPGSSRPSAVAIRTTRFLPAIDGTERATPSWPFLRLRLRLLPPEAHAHLAVHRRRGGQVLLGPLPSTRPPVEIETSHDDTERVIEPFGDPDRLVQPFPPTPDPGAA